MRINREFIRRINCYVGQNKPRYIVLHDMGNSRADALQHAKAHNNGNLATSWHYGVGPNVVYQMIEDVDGAWAVGDGYPWSHITNTNTINIEMSDYTGDNYNVTLNTAVQLVKHLMNKYNIPISNVVRHYDASTKWCPARIMNAGNWKDILGMVVGTPITPTTPTPSPDGKTYVNLKPVRNSWAVYPTNAAPVKANACGHLNPAKFNGLSYLILGNPYKDVYTIKTDSFGEVNIYCPNDNEGYVGAPAFGVVTGNGSNVPAPPAPVPAKSFLNLHAHMPSWRVYNENGPYIINNSIGALAPATYKGLSYEILGTKAKDVYVIQTAMLGRVAIYAPKDNDSSITNSPLY